MPRPLYDTAPGSAPARALLAALLRPGPDDEPWWDEALCPQTDPEVFFPPQGVNIKDAKGVCLACPVRQACLDWALDTAEPYGVWGGVSERARRRMRARRPREALAS